MKTLYLCGAGNPDGVRLALTIQGRTPRWDRFVILDDDPALRGRHAVGVEVVGGFDVLTGADPRCSEVVNLVARTTAKRRAAREKIARYGISFAQLVHPDVDVTGAELSGDVLVYERAVVSTEVQIGAGSVLFTGAVAGHESKVGANCVLAAGSVLNARVVLEEGVYVGTNAAVLPEVRVGAGATIGACSAVVHDVPAGATAVGVPAELLVAACPSRPREDEPRAQTADELETVLMPLWASVLGRATVGATESFFDAGGTSLLALEARARIEEATGIRLAVTDLFRFPTLRALAIHLAARSDPTREGPSREHAPSHPAGVRVLRRRVNA